MNLSRVDREDLEDIICDMMEDVKKHNLQIYDKYNDILEDIMYEIGEEEAIEIVHSFKPYGEAFSMDKVKEILHRQGKSDANCIDYYLVMNMIYNDYKTFAEMKRMDVQDFCLEMSKLFIEDTDAPKHKVSRYFSMYIDE